MFAVMLSAWYGGIWSGLLAVAMALALNEILHMESVVAINVHDDAIRVFLFITLSIIVSFWANRQKRAAEERSRLIGQLHQATREREQFMAILAHDLRSPATAIIGWSRLGRRGQLKDPESIIHAFDVIERNARQQGVLMDNMLRYAALSAGGAKLAISQFDLVELVDEALDGIRPSAELKSIQLTREVDKTIYIAGDRGAILQALLNLLWNAVKFTPDHGSVLIKAHVDQLGVKLVVADSGPGIPEEAAAQIFEPFKTGTKTGQAGTGLGLAIVRDVIEKHSGSVRLLPPQAGAGATFELTLPREINSQKVA
jgi:signal transduction histidine kinase